MICPNCRAEYVEGVTECYDCHVQLVKRLPEPGKPIEFQEVLRTFNQGDIALIRSMLDDVEIEYFFRGEIFNLVDPLIQPARLFVRNEHVADAKELLKGLNVSFLGISTRDDDSALAD
jgi:hypothetical protein